MAKYYLAPSLRTLRSEIDRAHPNRDRRSDGWLGDASHAAKKSDHNPDYPDGGVVRALDVDKDGVDMDRLLKAAIANPATNYVIWRGHIYSRAYSFRKRAYTGINKHYAHMHISIRHGRSFENRTQSWGYRAGATPTTSPSSPASTTKASPVPLQRAVRTTADGVWGPATDKRCNAVIEASEFGKVDFPYGVGFTQQVVGAKADGKWGPNSIEAHKATVKNMQLALKAMGVDPGAADGVWGAKSHAAYVSARSKFRR